MQPIPLSSANVLKLRRRSKRFKTAKVVANSTSRSLSRFRVVSNPKSQLTGEKGKVPRKRAKRGPNSQVTEVIIPPHITLLAYRLYKADRMPNIRALHPDLYEEDLERMIDAEWRAKRDTRLEMSYESRALDVDAERKRARRQANAINGDQETTETGKGDASVDQMASNVEQTVAVATKQESAERDQNESAEDEQGMFDVSGGGALTVDSLVISATDMATDMAIGDGHPDVFDFSGFQLPLERMSSLPQAYDTWGNEGSAGRATDTVMIDLSPPQRFTEEPGFCEECGRELSPFGSDLDAEGEPDPDFALELGSPSRLIPGDDVYERVGV